MPPLLRSLLSIFRRSRGDLNAARASYSRSDCGADPRRDAGAPPVPTGLTLGTTVYPLDRHQLAVATAPPDLPQLVLAPPGTGKTHVVVARICYLIEKENLAPYEVLVLCFTRTAVRVVKHRIRDLIAQGGVHDDTRFVIVRTFDSFTTRALLGARGRGDLTGFNYDQRIELATEALEDPDSEASELVASYRHLIVDEVQDVVGPRARLVQALLARIAGGFTILGDPAQAIYDFSLQDSRNPLTSQELLNWVRRQTWLQSLQEPELADQHRNKSQSATVAAKIRPQLLKTATDDRRALAAMRTLVDNLVLARNSDSTSLLSKSTTGDTVCVLCRTHGEVLQLASLFARRGVPFCVRPRPEDHGLPAWVARVLGTCNSARLSRAQFEKRWGDLVGADLATSPADAWEWLKQVEGRDEADLQLGDLAQQFSRGHTLPDEADAYAIQDTGGLALSTVHAAKGREFDRVLILQPDTADRRGLHDSPLEEARVLYVAATRARHELARLGRQGLPRMWREECCDGRRRWSARDEATGERFVEIGLLGDVPPGSAVNRYVNRDASTAEEVQEFLWSGITPGTPVQITLRRRGQPGRYYAIEEPEASNRGVRLGQLSLSFMADLQQVLEHRAGPAAGLPASLGNDARVAAIVTEVIAPYLDKYHEPFATTRFCLGVRVRGMGFLYEE